MAYEMPGTIEVAPPPIPGVTLVPVTGPPGPQGPPGDSAEVLGYRHTQSSPAMLVQVTHNLPYKPAGIICTETDGYQLEYGTVTHPLAGVTELHFGVPFVGVIDLS